MSAQNYVANDAVGDSPMNPQPDLVLSRDERRVLLAIGQPWDSTKYIRSVSGKDLKRARFLAKQGLAHCIAGAGEGRYYFVRTEVGQKLARELCEIVPDPGEGS